MHEGLGDLLKAAGSRRRGSKGLLGHRVLQELQHLLRTALASDPLDHVVQGDGHQRLRVGEVRPGPLEDLRFGTRFTDREDIIYILYIYIYIYIYYYIYCIYYILLCYAMLYYIVYILYIYIYIYIYLCILRTIT